jgi:hypothetical protein
MVNYFKLEMVYSGFILGILGHMGSMIPAQNPLFYVANIRFMLILMNDISTLRNIVVSDFPC